MIYGPPLRREVCRTRVFEWKSPNSQRTKQARQEKSKVNGMLTIFTSRGLFTKNSSRNAKPSIPYTAVTFYGACVNVRWFRLELGDKNRWQLHNDKARFQTPFYAFSLIGDKTERVPFLNNCGDGGRIANRTEQPHRTRLTCCINKMAEALGTAYARWWPVRSTLVSD
jgi:hypothetical protein